MRLIFAMLVIWLGTASAALAQASAVSVELTLDQDQFLPDEEMVVGVRISNRTGQTINLGKEADWVSFSIQGENNYIASKIGELSPVEEFSLSSSQVGTPRFNLTPCFNFRQIGRYRMTATVKIPGWNTEITSKPKLFTVMNGVSIPGLPDLEIGVPPPPGVTNSPPEVRRFVLQKATYLKHLKLYFRLTDASGSKTFCVYPIGQMVSFGQPEVQIDRMSNLHVLHQVGARDFNYCVIDPNGRLFGRQTHEYTATRPVLRADAEGRIFVSGGARRPAVSDLPPPPAPTPITDVTTPKP